MKTDICLKKLFLKSLVSMCGSWVTFLFYYFCGWVGEDVNIDE